MCLQVTLYVYNWSVDLGGSLNQGLVRLVHWQNARAHVVNCLLSQKMGLFHHYCFSDTPTHDDLKQVSIQTLWLCSQCNTSMLTIYYKQYMKQTFQMVICYVVVTQSHHACLFQPVTSNYLILDINMVILFLIIKKSNGCSQFTTGIRIH